MAKYVIKYIYYDLRQSEFVGEGTYIFQGEKYAVFARYLNEAKRYSSKGRAKSAAEKLLASCVNTSSHYEILEV